MNRKIRHLTTTRWHLRRCFPEEVLDQIETAIRAVERTHAGELRVAIEAALDLDDLLANVRVRDRAIAAFNELRVWDTAANNGVLIYTLLADHAIEIVADRGYNGLVAEHEWRAACAAGETEFRSGQYARGAIALVSRVGALIARHYPPRISDANELPDRPTLL